MAVAGWIGLGKLGAPCAAALARTAGHEIVGYDVRGTNYDDYHWYDDNPNVAFDDSSGRVDLVDSVQSVVAGTDRVVFVAVQTPHVARYGGETFIDGTLTDFEYGYLINAVREVVTAATQLGKDITLVVVSTVLPGTFDRYLRPLINTTHVTAVYHPFFIAMGSVVSDFTEPEMTLFGVDKPGDEQPVRDIYASLHPLTPPAPVMSIPSAELTKVAYNTYITSKIVFANALAQLADATGADVDSVTDALSYARDRIISSKYMRAGMGDGGACHPRDNIALAALAQAHGIRGNYFYELISLREQQSEYFAELLQHWAEMSQLPIAVLGRAYKADLGMDAGSPALLLTHSLDQRGVEYTAIDPVMDVSDDVVLVDKLEDPHVYFIATAHTVFIDTKFPSGAIVIDPFGITRPQAGVTLITPGRRRWPNAE